MTLEEIAQGLRKVQEAAITLDEALRNGSRGPDADKHKARALKAAHQKLQTAFAFLPQIIAAVEEGQAGVDEDMLDAVVRYEVCNTPNEDPDAMTGAIIEAIRPYLRTPLPLPPSSPQGMEEVLNRIVMAKGCIEDYLAFGDGNLSRAKALPQKAQDEMEAAMQEGKQP